MHASYVNAFTVTFCPDILFIDLTSVLNDSQNGNRSFISMGLRNVKINAIVPV